MKKVLCCLKGEGSGQRSPERDNVENPVGNNEFLNYANRHDLENPGAHPLQQIGVTFQWREILKGTGDLLFENYLGSGRYGEVYRCDLPNDNGVGAAKIEKEDNESAHAEFVAELTTLNRTRHPNVIKLIGKSFGRTKSAIVYEYMPNGSLYKHLFGESTKGARFLDWDRRMVIALGVAKALLYLHNELKVFHRHVNSSNVLLDENFMPKLTDFGMACNIVVAEDGDEKIDRVISPLRGTNGYMPRETFELGVATSKSDIYCYGILLLELLTGRKAYDIERPEGKHNIKDWLMPFWKRRYDYIPLVVDPALDLRRYNVKGLVGVFEVARMCTHKYPSQRPDMNTVEELVSQAASYPAPQCPSFTRRLSF